MGSSKSKPEVTFCSLSGALFSVCLLGQRYNCTTLLGTIQLFANKFIGFSHSLLPSDLCFFGKIR